MGSDEFTEWLAYERIDPGDPERSDARAAQLEVVIRNLFREKHAEPIKLGDCMLTFKDGNESNDNRRIPANQLALKLSAFKFTHDLTGG
jgi:hypothetical protein